MIHEKSCGALIYRKQAHGYEILLIRHRSGGHWSFPKGHVERSETETETALREIWEETGLEVTLHQEFRQSVEYFPKPHVKKQVVYFLATPKGDDTVHRQEEEVSEFRWCSLETVGEIVTFKNDKNLVEEARHFLELLEKGNGNC